MTDKTLGKARGLNSIADPKNFKGSSGRAKLTRRPEDGASGDRVVNEAPTAPTAPAPTDRRSPEPSAAPERTEAVVTPSTQESPPPSSGGRATPAGVGERVDDAFRVDDADRVDDASPVDDPGSDDAGPANETDGSSEPVAAVRDNGRSQQGTATRDDDGRRVGEAARAGVAPVDHVAAERDAAGAPAATPSPSTAGASTALAAPHRAVQPGVQRKRRELSIPHQVAEALEATGINPADVVMSGYRHHGDAIYAGAGGRMAAKGRTRLRLSISDTEFEQITRLGLARGWNRSETVSVILAMELDASAAPG